MTMMSDLSQVFWLPDILITLLDTTGKNPAEPSYKNQYLVILF